MEIDFKAAAILAFKEACQDMASLLAVIGLMLIVAAYAG